MNVRIDLDPDLSARTDTLEHGRSAAWQEEWLPRIETGIAAADAGDFADEADISALLAKYR